MEYGHGGSKGRVLASELRAPGRRAGLSEGQQELGECWVPRDKKYEITEADITC